MKTSSLVLISIIVIFLLTGVAIFVYDSFSEGDIFGIGTKIERQIPLEESSKGESDYPTQILEGFIMDIITYGSEENLKGIKLKANVGKIFPWENLSSEFKLVMVLINEKTEFSLFDLDIQEGSPLEVEDFKIGDGVVVAIQESNKNILNQDVFTGTRVTKILLSPDINQ